MSSERHTYSVAKLIEDNILTIGDGYRAKNVELASTGIPFARVANIDGGFNFAEADLFPLDGLYKVGEKISRPGDVVLTSKGTVGRFAFVREGTPQFVYSPQLSYWRSLDFNTIDSRFLFYWIQGEEFQEQADGVKSQTDMADYVSLTDQRRMKITLPPLPEQRTIARILGLLDDKIELNHRINHTLEGMARALFKSWFVDFDPITAKAEGRVPFGMNAETASLFPAEFEESRLGSIPKGWNVDKVSAIGSTQYGYTASASDEPVGSKFLRITDINKEPWIEWEKVPFCPSNDSIKEKYGLSIGDVLVSRMADPGKAGIVEQEIDAVFASYLVRLKAKNLAWSYFLFYFLRSDQYLDYADGVKSGSVQLGMNAKVIVDADVILPSDSIIESFLKRVLPLRKKIVSNLMESNSLASVRDSVLPKLLSGELRVKQAEKVIENM